MTSFITPTIALSFTTGVLDPRITLTRSLNTATAINSSGNIAVVNADLPRFDYDPITLACKGLLVEETRTNVLRYTETFSDAAWSKSNCSVTPNTAISPDGTQNADLFLPSASPAQLFQANTKAASATPYTFSFYIKRSGLSVFRAFVFGASNANRGEATFNLSSVTTSAVSSVGTFTSTSATITPAKNGYYRCTVTTTTNTDISVSGNLRYDGTVDGASGFLIYGGQLEEGAFATSYIPNLVTGTATRNADVATITGSNFTDFWNSVQGGATVQALPSTVSGIRPLVQYDDGTANEIIALRGNTTNPELYVVDDGTPQAQLDAGTIAANTAYALTGWWATDDCKARQDSGAVVTDTTATIPTVTQMRIGSDGTNYLNGTIATIGYYDSFFGRPIYTRRKNKVFPSLL
jgi:hypothetical protein